MISMAELSSAWDAIVPQPGQNIGRRADENHPLDFFITYDENGNMQMILTADYLPLVPASSRQLSVRANTRHDGKYALCFSLADRSLRDQYVSLCWDIMNCSSTILDKKIGTMTAVKRFCLWQKLFAAAKDRKLSDAELKGLIGELCVMKRVILMKYTPHTALTSWIGPIGADRDFEMPSEWYEVKAVSLSKDTVSISSLDQLDTDMEGSLLIVRVERTSPNVPGSFTLNSLVSEVRAGLTDWDRAVFDARMASIKFDFADPRADEQYIFHGIETYKVNDSFPRIRRSKVPASISNAAYDLSIPSLQSWRQD